MNKKLMAVAVAGALATPMAALAQTSTVQVYGLVNVEYGFVNQPDISATTGRSNVDALNSGASRLGFRGEEQLGGGLSAWFQCETDFRFLGGNTETSGSWCDRNSALGMKGAFGNIYIGTWDAPMKRVAGITRITNETGWTGSQLMTLSNAGAFGGCFSLRNPHSVNYDTPNWGGFSASFQYTTLQTARNAPGNEANLAPGNALNNNSVPTPKGRKMSLSGQYVGGPFAVVAAYSRSDDDRSDTRAAFGFDGGRDKAWLIGGTYTWGPVKVGLTYIDAEYDVSNGAWPGALVQNRERKSWNLAGEWNISGPHGLRAGFAYAGDVDRSGSAVPGAAGAAGNNKLDDGAKLYQIGYLYSFSKRTNATIIYAYMNNDSLGTYALTGNSGTVRAGDNSGVLAFQLQHTF
ncbi:MAG TPA: porin [Burkholderiales bacterium]|nr:porin [Burkholderiales bacterium]